MDDTNVSFRYSLKQFNNKPKSVSRENSATSLRQLNSANSTRTASALTSKRLDSATSSKRHGSAVAVTRRSDNGNVTPASAEGKPRAKTSVGPARRNDTLSEMFKQQKLIDVKGRPLSAPVTDTPPASDLRRNKQTKDRENSVETRTKDLGLKLELPRLLSAKSPEALQNQKRSIIKLKSEIRKANESHNANTSKQTVSSKTPARMTRPTDVSPAQKPHAPFWFYRSKADFLLQSTNDGDDADADDVVEARADDASPQCTPRSARSDHSAVASPRQDNHEPAATLADVLPTASQHGVTKPKSLVPQIYVYDSYQKRFISCTPRGSPRPSKTIENVDTAEAAADHDQTTSRNDDKAETEIIDLLRRNHRPNSQATRMREEVMRSLPLQSDLDKYVWWLESKKNRDGRFTNSMNRLVPLVNSLSVACASFERHFAEKYVCISTRSV